MTVLVKFQIEIEIFVELHWNSELSMMSCPPPSVYLLELGDNGCKEGPIAI